MIVGIAVVLYIRMRLRQDSIALSQANFAYNNPMFALNEFARVIIDDVVSTDSRALESTSSLPAIQTARLNLMDVDHNESHHVSSRLIECSFANSSLPPAAPVELRPIRLSSSSSNSHHRPNSVVIAPRPANIRLDASIPGESSSGAVSEPPRAIRLRTGSDHSEGGFMETTNFAFDGTDGEHAL